MRELNKCERKKVRALIDVPIPEYIKGGRDDADGQIDLMYCYEIGFMFAHDLLKNHKIDPRFSPWGDEGSVIFDDCYAQMLQNLLISNLGKEVNEYCRIYLNALEIFKAHFTQQE